MRKVSSIPTPTGGNDPEVLRALVNVVAFITAQQQPKIELLSTGASLADVVNKVNEIIRRLQAQ